MIPRLLTVICLLAVTTSAEAQNKTKKPPPTREEIMGKLMPDGDSFSEDDVLALLEQGYRTCVSQLQREGTALRLSGPADSRLVFDMKDMRLAQVNADGSLVLECDTPGCVAVKYGNPISGTWADMAPQNSVSLNCSDSSKKIARLTYYYYLRYTNWLAYPMSNGRFREVN